MSKSTGESTCCTARARSRLITSALVLHNVCLLTLPPELRPCRDPAGTLQLAATRSTATRDKAQNTSQALGAGQLSTDRGSQAAPCEPRCVFPVLQTF